MSNSIKKCNKIFTIFKEILQEHTLYNSWKTIYQE